MKANARRGRRGPARIRGRRRMSKDKKFLEAYMTGDGLTIAGVAPEEIETVRKNPFKSVVQFFRGIVGAKPPQAVHWQGMSDYREAHRRGEEARVKVGYPAAALLFGVLVWKLGKTSLEEWKSRRVQNMLAELQAAERVSHAAWRRDFADAEMKLLKSYGVSEREAKSLRETLGDKDFEAFSKSVHLLIELGVDKEEAVKRTKREFGVRNN